MSGHCQGQEAMKTREHLSFGAREFIVDVAVSERKRLSITVHPDLRITAKAPLGQEPGAIRSRLKKRAPWIARQLDYFERFQPIHPGPRFVSGETHYYLGRQYRLRIRPGENARVRLIGRFFQMELPDPGNGEKARELMRQWFSAHAATLFTRRLKAHLPAFAKKGAPTPEARFRRMKKRWGGCSGEGVIMLNTELVILATVMVCDFKARRLSTAPRRLMRRGAGREARSNGRLAPGSLVLAAGHSILRFSAMRYALCAMRHAPCAPPVI